MKKTVYLTSILLIILFSTSMNTSTVFPSLACTDLLNNPITIPKDIKGKKSILVLAASKKAEDNLQSWMLPLFNTFIADNSKNMFATTSYDVNTFFIPVFSGVAKAAANNIKKKMLNGLDPLLQSHVLIYKGSANKLFDELGLDKKEVALLIIDENGNTLKTIEGGYTDEKMENIEEFLIQ